MTSLPSPQDSLLAQTNPGTINELFNRDPSKLTDADLEKMVEYFRGKRDEFLLTEGTGRGNAPTGAKTKAEPKAKLTLDALKELKFGELTL